MSPVPVIRDPKQDEAIENNTCYMGGEKVFYQPVSEHDEQKASGPGHIYSEAGLKEYKISGACEYHFDEAFAEPLDDLEAIIDEESRCPDCGKEGERRGHMECQNPTTESEH
jgi:hypothetical protein